MRANERTDERVAQYHSLYSWLFSTIVHFGDFIQVLRRQPDRACPASTSQLPVHGYTAKAALRSGVNKNPDVRIGLLTRFCLVIYLHRSLALLPSRRTNFLSLLLDYYFFFFSDSGIFPSPASSPAKTGPYR